MVGIYNFFRFFEAKSEPSATILGEIKNFFLYSFTFVREEKKGVFTGPGQTTVTKILFFLNS